MIRSLSETFMQDLLLPDGRLHPILDRVHKDQTLMLAIRARFINIYYRGGNIARITEKKPGFYQAFFDAKYNLSGQALPDLPALIRDVNGSRQWAASFPWLKQVMDEFLGVHNKPEREFQQLVARENNHSPIANESEYFITDIEFADSTLNARFDLIGIRWDAIRRGDTQCRAAFFEMKYGDDALGGSAGILKHLQDFDAMVCDEERYTKLLQTMESQFQQLDQLGLLKFTRNQSGVQVRLNLADKPEVIFILANHNPRSEKLKGMLNLPEMDEYARSKRFDLRFFVSSFAGYGLHARSMLPLAEFRKLL